MAAIEEKQLIDVIMQVVSAVLADVHTATIAKVTAVTGSTLSCKPVTNRVVDGESVELPEFIEVPVITLYGGPSYIALPITVGDYALLIFTERCFDRWWIGQDFKSPPQLRMHDYSDGFALVGVKPLLSGIPIPSETTLAGVLRLGSPEPTDAMALASKVLTELTTLRTDLEAFKLIYNAHTHICAAVGVASAVPVAPAVLDPTPPSSVASILVKAD